MKKYRIVPIILVIFMLLGGCGDGRKNVNEYTSEQTKIMDGMMEKMDEVEASGSAALDFLNQMIPHHQSAVEMSQSYLQHSGDKGQFRELAENIVKTQEKEITQMEEMIDRIREEGQMDEEQEKLYLAEYTQMMEKHHSSHEAQAEQIDQAFAEGMSMHHQMAVDMSKMILKYTQDPELLQLANAMIDQQEKEISRMEQGMDEHKH